MNDALDRDGGGFTAADAKRCNTALQALRLEGVRQGHDEARAGSADGVAERAGAAIDVEFFARDAEIARRRHRYNGECLIDLEQIDVADAPANLVEQLADRGDGRGREPLWFLAGWRDP